MDNSIYRPPSSSANAHSSSTNGADDDPVGSQSAVASRKSQDIGTIPNFHELGLLEGDEAIKASGLVPKHVKLMAELASSMNTIFMFRPVNKLSTDLLANGAAAKGMSVKNKSSDWGPMAGLIPSDPRLSKQWEKYLPGPSNSQAVEHAVDKPADGVYSRPLFIDQRRVDKLTKSSQPLFRLEPDAGGASAGARLVTILDGNSGLAKQNQYFEFRLIPEGIKGVAVEYREKQNPSAEWKSVEVISAKVREGKKENTFKPITADYDVFAFLPKMDTLSYQNTSRGQAGGRFRNVVEQVQRVHLGQIDRLTSKPDIGREPAWQAEIRKTINLALTHSGGDLIKHASEQDNVYVPEKDDNILIIMPDQKTYITQSWKEVQAFMHVANFQNHVVYTNRNYNHKAGTRPIYSDMTKPQLKDDGKRILFNERLAYLQQTAKKGQPST